MKILSIKPLVIPDIKVIEYMRFSDNRGYFTEHYRKTDFLEHSDLEFIKDTPFVQCNESFSRKSTVRGLHYQYDPDMGKLVRIITGHMIDLQLDVRKDSPTFGKIIGYEMKSSVDSDTAEWIWIPAGFAHGVCFIEDSLIEYFCTAQYTPEHEYGISPFANDIDWSLCDKDIKRKFEKLSGSDILISDKDINEMTLSDLP